MNVLVDRVEDGHRVDGRRELEDVREVLEPRVVFAVLVVRVVVRGAGGVGHGRRREGALDVRRGERLSPGGVVFVVPAFVVVVPLALGGERAASPLRVDDARPRRVAASPSGVYASRNVPRGKRGPCAHPRRAASRRVVMLSNCAFRYVAPPDGVGRRGRAHPRGRAAEYQRRHPRPADTRALPFETFSALTVRACPPPTRSESSPSDNVRIPQKLPSQNRDLRRLRRTHITFKC